MTQVDCYIVSAVDYLGKYVRNSAKNSFNEFITKYLSV
jgi:hypothetical protein